MNGCCTYLDDDDELKTASLQWGDLVFALFQLLLFIYFVICLKCCLLQICNRLLEKWLYLVLDIGKYVKK